MDSWISVKDKIPATNQRVVVLGEFDIVEVGYFDKDLWFIADNWESISKPLYWMPLPPLPEPLKGE